MKLHPIAHIITDFSSKFGIPRQSGLVKELTGTIVFEAPYRNPDFLKGFEEYSHCWLIWGFSENKHKKISATVRPPRLGGNVRKGVFATRSPYRPNPLGLSCVKIDQVLPDTPKGPQIIVRGADLLNGTPIYDIKPYIAFSDSIPDAVGGFADKVYAHALSVHCESHLLVNIPEEKQQSLLEILAQDPRPSYQEDKDRIYGMEYCNRNIRFQVDGTNLTVLSIE